MNNSRYHVISKGKKWALWREDANKAQKIFESRDDAVDAAKRYLKKCFDVVVHKNDGSVSKWYVAK